jgi:DNA-directed RNA polymerase subunit M/transcription elongation factor TFIIS
MHVYEVDDFKALWLSLRADSHMILEKVLKLPKDQVHVFEEKVYMSVVGEANINITPYHMTMYRELLCHIRSAHPDLVHGLVKDFNATLPKLIKSFTSHISVFLHAKEEVKEFGTESQRLFHKELRPQLMALAANIESNLPSCPTCNTNEYMTIVPIQTRSADEAATLFPKCMKCQKLLTDKPLNC